MINQRRQRFFSTRPKSEKDILKIRTPEDEGYISAQEHADSIMKWTKA